MIKRVQLYHIFYRRSGFYRFLRSSVLSLIWIALVIMAVTFAFEQFTPGIAHYFSLFSDAVMREIVLMVFFISESFLGLIPPDLFIIWAEQLPNPWWVITILAVLSYVGGLVSYKVGSLFGKTAFFQNNLGKRFSKEFAMLNKWGNFLIVIAALFPLPFSPTCIGAGMSGYSFKSLATFGLFRLVRIYGYALFLFWVL